MQLNLEWRCGPEVLGTLVPGAPSDTEPMLTGHNEHVSSKRRFYSATKESGCK
jgi:hypothetical protein